MACRILVSICLSSVLLCGCLGYRVGPTTGEAAGGRSVQINPFLNQTPEPRLVEPLTFALRKRLQQDGTYRLATSGQADIVVSGVLIRYEREGVAFRPEDILTPRDFVVRLHAKVTASDRTSGKKILDQEVSGWTALRPGADLVNAERQVVPLLAEDLARNIVALLADGTW